MKFYPKNPRQFLIAILRLPTAFFLVVCLLLYFFQERVIFFPSKLPSDYQFPLKVPFEEKYHSVDDQKIHSLLLRVPSSEFLILYFHGNAGDLSNWSEAAQDIVLNTKTSVWIIDYPGYGKSEGKIGSEQQLHTMAAAFLKSAADLVGGEGKVIVYGRSLGSGIAAKLAADHKPAALILETPYFNLEAMAGAHYPWAPLFLLRYRFESDHAIVKVGCPILILHGDSDEVIPYIQGRLLSILNSKAKLVTIKNGRHNDLEAYPEFWSELSEFLKQVMI